MSPTVLSEAKCRIFMIVMVKICSSYAMPDSTVWIILYSLRLMCVEYQASGLIF